MYDAVNIGLNQKVPAVDFNRFGELPRAGMSALTRHALAPGLAFADFGMSFAGSVLTYSEGFLYKVGGQYRAEGGTLSFINQLPPSEGLKRIVSIVAFANPAQLSSPEPREFAVQVTPASSTTAASYQTEVRTTSTLSRQIATVASVVSDALPQPQPPTIAADQCEIARITLGVGGIESVLIIEANRMPNLALVAKATEDNADFIQVQGKRIDTIDKNLAALAAVRTPVSEATIRQYGQNLSILNELTRAKVGDLSYGSEVGLDLRHTDNTVAGYAAYVGDGIRFPWQSQKTIPLTLYTPGDNAVKVINGLMLPDFVEEARITVLGMDGQTSISSQVNTITTAVKQTVSRSRVRTGEPFTVCNNAAFWQSGKYDAATQIFKANGETFNAVATGVDYGAPVGYAPGTHIEFRLQKTWTDTWTEERWSYKTESIGLNGTIRGQTFRVPDFGYLTSIDLPFTTKDAAFGVTLLLCETTSGQPNLNAVIEKCDLTAANVTADTKGLVRTKFAFRPAFVDPGKLYAWVTVTRGNYQLAHVKDNKFAEGSSFITTDGGAFFQGDVTIDFPFTANFARFKSPRIEVRMNDVDNSNGDVISALDFLFGSTLPSGTELVHRVKRSGGDFIPVARLTSERKALDTQPAGPFSSAPLPVSVQQTIVFTGTTTLMPAIDLNQAWVTALRLGATLNHFTELLQMGTPVNRVEVQVTVDGPFDAVNHTNGCKLVVGGTPVTPSATTFVVNPDRPGQRTYTYLFTLGATTTAFRINITGTLASVLSTYHVDNRFFRAWLV